MINFILINLYSVFILSICSVAVVKSCKPFGWFCSCKVKSGNGLVDNSDQFRQQLADAKPGTTIRLAALHFQGSFVAKVSGTGSQPIEIMGRTECGKSTTIVSGGPALTLDGVNNYNIRALVFQNTRNALSIKNAKHIDINSLVLNDIGGDGIVIDSTSDIKLNSVVLNNINGKGIQVKGKCNSVEIVNAVMKSVDKEMIDIGADVSHGKIIKAVVNGDSPNGDAWIKIDGNDFVAEKVVGKGRPKNGLLVNGCKYEITRSVLSIGKSNGYCIYAGSKAKSCGLQLDRSNVCSGGKGLTN